MNMRRLTDNGDYVPHNVVELPLQRGKHLTPSAADDQSPNTTRSTEMLTLVLMVVYAVWWLFVGYLIWGR